MLTLVVAGDAAQARAFWEQSIALARQIDRTDLAAVSLTFLGATTPDPMHRQALLEEAVTVARDLDDPAKLGDALVWLGVHHIVEGNVSLAQTYIEQGRVLYTATGNPSALGIALDGLGQVARLRGDRPAARTLFEEKLVLNRMLGDQHGIGFALQALGELAEEEGHAAEARAHYAHALRSLREVPDLERAMTVLRGLAALSLAHGQAARALRLAGAVAAAQAASGPSCRVDIAAQWTLAPPPNWEQIRVSAHTALGPAAQAAWAEGQAMSLEQAIAYALEEPEPRQ